MGRHRLKVLYIVRNIVSTIIEAILRIERVIRPNMP